MNPKKYYLFIIISLSCNSFTTNISGLFSLKLLVATPVVTSSRCKLPPGHIQFWAKISQSRLLNSPQSWLDIWFSNCLTCCFLKWHPMELYGGRWIFNLNPSYFRMRCYVLSLVWGEMSDNFLLYFKVILFGGLAYSFLLLNLDQNNLAQNKTS